jgi:hypothetical protein
MALGAWAVYRSIHHTDPFGGHVHATAWQVVILSNDHVYFGHLRTAGRNFYELDNAYFLTETPGPNGQTSRRVQPVSDEFQRPENHMLASRDKIVGVETLARDSPVLRAIQSQEPSR